MEQDFQPPEPPRGQGGVKCFLGEITAKQMGFMTKSKLEVLKTLAVIHSRSCYQFVCFPKPWFRHMFCVWMWNANSYLEATREITSVCQVAISKTFAPKNLEMSYSGRSLLFVELAWACHLKCTNTSIWCSERSGNTVDYKNKFETLSSSGMSLSVDC